MIPGQQVEVLASSNNWVLGRITSIVINYYGKECVEVQSDDGTIYRVNDFWYLRTPML